MSAMVIVILELQSDFQGWAENAGPENAGLKDEIPENAGPENEAPK